MAHSQEDLANRLAEMARTLLAKPSVQESLDAIVAFTVGLVGPCEHAGILVVDKGDIRTAAATDARTARSDTLQAELGEGPCLDALTQAGTFEISDMRAEHRWPRYAAAAVDLGILSVLGYPLTGKGTLGALNLHASHPHAFDEHSREVGLVLAAQAGVALAWAHTEAQLREALRTRQTIGEAVGILMERLKLTSEQAYDVLVAASQGRNVKLRDLAEHISTTGENPDVPGLWAPH